MNNLRLKTVMRRDEIQGHFRLFRIMWERGIVGDGIGYSNMLSFALQPKFFAWHHEAVGFWLVVICGLRVHRKRSFGGIFG